MHVVAFVDWSLGEFVVVWILQSFILHTLLSHTFLPWPLLVQVVRNAGAEYFAHPVNLPARRPA